MKFNFNRQVFDTHVPIVMCQNAFYKSTILLHIHKTKYTIHFIIKLTFRDHGTIMITSYYEKYYGVITIISYYETYYGVITI